VWVLGKLNVERDWKVSLKYNLGNPSPYHSHFSITPQLSLSQPQLTHSLTHPQHFSLPVVEAQLQFEAFLPISGSSSKIVIIVVVVVVVVCTSHPFSNSKFKESKLDHFLLKFS